MGTYENNNKYYAIITRIWEKYSCVVKIWWKYEAPISEFNNMENCGSTHVKCDKFVIMIAVYMAQITIFSQPGIILTLRYLRMYVRYIYREKC